MEEEFGGRVFTARLAVGVHRIDWLGKVHTFFMSSVSVQSGTVSLLDIDQISASHRLTLLY